MDPDRSLLEPIVHALEGQEELGQLAQEVEAEESVHQAQGEGASSARDLDGEAAREEVGLQEEAKHARVEEGGEAIGGLEEVEGVAGGRGVEDHEVEAIVEREVEQLLHGHVLVAAREGARDLAVEPVLQDPVPGRRVRRVALDERVEGALGVEGHGMERSASHGREGADVEGLRLAGETRLPEARGQTPRGIDGAGQDAAPPERGL
jgi:hypothetical protein